MNIMEKVENCHFYNNSIPDVLADLKNNKYPVLRGASSGYWFPQEVVTTSFHTP